MEKSRYNAIKGFEKREEARFFSYTNLLLLSIIAIALGYVLFPGKELNRALGNQQFLAEADFRYALLNLPKSSNLNLTISGALNSPMTTIKDLKRMLELQSEEFTTFDYWVAYIVLRSISLNPNANKDVKKEGIATLRKYFDFFEQKTKLSSNQYVILARDALAIDAAPWALKFFEDVIKHSNNLPASFYSEVAKTATWSKKCMKSSKYAIEAFKRSESLEDKRYLFFLSIQALFQCEEFALALKIAETHIEELQNDPLTYRLLADYALKAGRPDIASKYVMKLLEAQGFKKEKN